VFGWTVAALHSAGKQGATGSTAQRAASLPTHRAPPTVRDIIGPEKPTWTRAAGKARRR
jgi:hypothetical protein